MNVPLDKFADWLTNKNLKERTIENYLYYFNKFSQEPYNQESVSRFLSFKQNRNTVARSFLLNYGKFLLVNHKELEISDHLKVEIASVELPKLTGRKKQRIIRPIPHEQISLLEYQLTTEKLKLQLLLSYYCGLRLGELLKLKILSFDWDKWKKDPSKMGECRVFGKGDKEGIALVPKKLMVRLANFIHKQNFNSINSHLFINPMKENSKLNNLARNWQISLAKAGIRSGITKLGEDNKPIKETLVHPHRLRHSYASHLLNVMGLNLKEVQELLRHSDISNTMIYTHLDQEKLKEKLKDF